MPPRPRAGDRPGARRTRQRRRAIARDAGSRPRVVDRGLGGQIVAGRNAVRELLAAGRRPVREIFFAEGIDPAPILEEIASYAAKAGVPIRTIPRARLDQLAETEAPQGVVARAAALPEADLASLTTPHVPAGRHRFWSRSTASPTPTTSARSCGRGVGRSDGSCLDATPRRHVTPTVTKAAAGAIEYLPIAVVPGLPAALQELQSRGIWTVGLAGDATTDRVRPAGGRRSGVSGARFGRRRPVATRSPAVRNRGRIPRIGHTESLNVSAAAAVTCFEIARRRLAP